jgi:hypothetical protein
MRKKMISLALVFLLAACGPSKPSEQQRIDSAVAATLAAMPVATLPPTNTPLPTQTPLPTANPNGVYCEYGFCIGHPANMYYYDVFAVRDQSKPSTREFGQLATFNSMSFVTFMWQLNQGGDPQFMLDLVKFDTTTTRGNVDTFTAGSRAIYLAPTSTNNQVLPYGLLAAWTCGDRAFGWLAYAANESMLRLMLDETLLRLTCGE